MGTTLLKYRIYFNEYLNILAKKLPLLYFVTKSFIS